MIPGDAEAAAGGIIVPYRVRFDECGPDGVARTSTLLRYAQDVAWIHSERLGFDRDWYTARGLAWVVRTVELVLLLPVTLNATVAVSTRVVGVRRVWARRRTEIRLPDNSLAMWGHTDWVIIDARGLPVRIPSEISTATDMPADGFEPGRVRLPAPPPDAAVTRVDVRPQDLDPMAHVNNAAYVDYLEDALLAAGGDAADVVARPARTIRIEYLLPAPPRATLTAAVWRDAVEGLPGWAWRLTDAEGSDIARARVLEDA